MIRRAGQQDSAAIARIYNWYIENTIVTFEEVPVTAAAMAQRITVGDDSCPWFVLEEADAVIGYAYATWWKQRAAYRHTRESTVYLDHNALGAGHGRRLYQFLIDELRAEPIHVLVAGISLPNPASVALHERLGFLQVGQMREVGQKFGNFIDVGYWQLIL